MKRRAFLSFTAVGSLAAGMGQGKSVSKLEKENQKRSPVPVIHQTDLFRPHADPDIITTWQPSF